MRLALARLRARRRQTVLAAVGIVAAAAMAGTAITVGLSLSTGFERAADRADLPDVIARFDARSLRFVDERLRAVPNLEARSYRLGFTRVPLASGRHRTNQGGLDLVLGGRRGYAVVEGRDVDQRRGGEAVVDRGLAREWGLRPGSRLRIGGGAPARVVGIAVAPENVAYPLARVPRAYMAAKPLERFYGPAPASVAQLWVRDRSQLDATLVQARAVSAGLRDLRLVTRDGVQVLIGQAAGIVVALLGAFSLVALLAAGLMLGASSAAEVQRRLPGIAVQRAVGFSRRQVVGSHALEAALIAAPAAALGLAVGALVALAPTDSLLETLNQLGPGWGVLVPLVGAWLAIVGLVALAAAWPAWRAARRPPAELLRGGDLAPASARGRGGSRSRAGFAALGARLGRARRGRLASTIAVLSAATAVILLMLSLASLLDRLRDDPALLGKRYQLTVDAGAATLDQLRAVPGVADVSDRYLTDGAASFSLGQPVRLVAFPGDHTRFEAPPLASGRRVRAPDEAEVGVGLAETLGLREGSPLAVQLGSGAEARFRVVGLTRALDNDGRIAHVMPDRLLHADPALQPLVAIRVAGGADPAEVSRRLAALGARPQVVGGATTSNARFLGVLADVLRVVAIVNAVICLYALIQALALLARERRATVAVLRATGAGRREVALLFAGAALIAVVPAAIVGVLLERFVLGPAVAALAADYAELPLAAGLLPVVAVTFVLLALAGAAAVVMARRAGREPVVAGLRAE